ncbi:MAG TPA: polysaccharide deacetylase family protein [Dongiaceae bacterium]
MTSWADLARELELWAASGRDATWWWRDDDAVADSPALRQLLDLGRNGLGLAVIPGSPTESLTESLAPALGDHPHVFVLQHGFSHRNQAEPGAKKNEFPDSRDPTAIDAELATGRRRLRDAFGNRFLSVLTPPWNRIGDRTLPRLKQLGFRGLSRYQSRKAPEFHGLQQINTHVDVIDWQGGRGFLGEAACLGLFLGHLQARRTGHADRDEPTGLLTHHIVHDATTWRFLQKLRDFLAEQPAARLLDPAAAFCLE